MYYHLHIILMLQSETQGKFYIEYLRDLYGQVAHIEDLIQYIMCPLQNHQLLSFGVSVKVLTHFREVPMIQHLVQL